MKKVCFELNLNKDMPYRRQIVVAFPGTNSFQGPWFKSLFFEHFLNELALCGGGGNLISRLAIKKARFLSFSVPEITTCRIKKNLASCGRLHSGCLDSENILSTIDPPPGVPGVSKIHIFFSTNESVFLLR